METGRLVLVGFGIGLGALAASAACGSSSAGTASSEDGGGSSSSGGTSSGGASSGGSSTSSSGGSPFPVGEGGFPFGGFDAGPINCYGASDCTEGGAGQACCFDMATYGASCQMGPCSSYTQCKTSSECPSKETGRRTSALSSRASSSSRAPPSALRTGARSRA